MPLSGFLLVLAAAFCHATWNVCVKRISGGPELIWLFSLISVILYLPVALWIIVTEDPIFGPPQILFTAGSAVLHLGYFLLLQTGYRKGDLSLVYPIARATGPLLSTSFAVMFLGEHVTLQMAVAAAIIIGGVLMLSGGVKPGATKVPASLGFGLGAGALIGSYTAWDAYTVATLLVPPLLLDYASSVGRVVLLSPYAHRHKAKITMHWTHHRLAVITIAVFNPLAYILVLYALTFTPVSYVAPTREISVVLTVLAGSLLLGEGHLKHRLIWACVILAGTTLLVLG
ncbi:DMT family transporter [Marivita hallyeonensis]|uniref:EamA-like transporter family protein n=1 Tax=Marivita hallyeonensis TaxID=996342 RepID=A0A1M5TRI7_9RHOB|nr:DMT family transporter [Marivita hallyeonensis]SHH53344.1 EamA-like transporter family protein [Marivita hallyeonensis]